MRFRLKIMVCMLCLVSILFGTGSSALIFLSFQNGRNREKQSAVNSYKMLMHTLQAAGNMGTFSGKQDIQELLRMIAGQKGTYWDGIILSTKEETLYSQGDTAEYLSEKKGNSSEKTWTVTSLQTKEGKNYLKISGSFSVGGQPLYLEAAHDITALYENRDRQQNAYHIIFVITMFLCAAIAYSAAYLLTYPLKRLSEGTRELAQGNLAFRTDIQSNDEIGCLSKNFDRMAEQIQQNVRELKQAVERQERFVGSFTHELKTPMTAVIGYADLLRSQELSEEERQDAANYIFSEGKRLERLSLKLLDIYVAERTQIHPASHSPGQIASEIVDHLKSGYETRGILLQERCEKGICMLEPDLFRSLLVNLIDNAGKAFLCDNDSEEVSSGQGDGHSVGRTMRHILVMVQMTERGCMLCVEDDGPGIPEGAGEHLTEAFYRVDKSRSRKQGGAGLGLTLCAKIAELHNGSMIIKNREAGGLRVTVYLNAGRDTDPVPENEERKSEGKR